MNEKIIKLYELLQDDDFSLKMKNITVDEAVELLSKEGLEFSKDEILNLMDALPEEEQELNIEDLEKISGGLTFKKYWGGLKSTLRGFWDGLTK